MSSQFHNYDIEKMTPTEIYGEVLTQMGKAREEIVTLTADLAKSTKTKKFASEFPERFFNVGIAEQNLFGIASGMALAGFLPFVSTFAVFASLRASEQIRTDICYQNLNCKIIATHSGLSFGQAGTTHHCTEDMGVMRSFANMTVIAPADGYAIANAVISSADYPGPVYIRIGREFERPVHKHHEYGYEIGKAITLHEGSDVTVIACGTGVLHAEKAARILNENRGIKVKVIDMHTIKPLDQKAVLEAIEETGKIITVENHSIIGGLGSAVAETIAESGKLCHLKRLGVPDSFSGVGHPEELQKYYSIDTEGIISAISEMVGETPEVDKETKLALNDDWKNVV